MVSNPVWFPFGSRLGTTFATTDSKVGALSGFICEVAREISRGRALSAAVRSAAARHPASVEAFELAGLDDASIEAGFALNDRLTFPNETLPETIGFEQGNASFRLRLDSLLAVDLTELFGWCGSASFAPNRIEAAFDEPASAVFRTLLERGVLISGPPPPCRLTAARTGPGITRLQHAGLMCRGRTAGILVDPHLHSSYEPEGLRDGFLRSDFEGLVDAIVISHSHPDHFHLPTLMTFGRDMPIVVPRSRRATMLCPDFAATLRSLGFKRVIALNWYDPPFVIGDLEVHALPFFGEQPLLYEAPRHGDLRNHGNTYVVRHDSYTSWLLVDSGNDPTGRMADVAHTVRARFGRIDLVASNLREFTPQTPLYITGAGHYWLSLTAEQVCRFDSMRKDLITLGPAGVADVCRIVEAGAFLPYAHWWGAVGGPAGTEEQSLLLALEACLKARDAATRIVPWLIGESHFSDLSIRTTTAHRFDDQASEHQWRLLDRVRHAVGPLSEATERAFLSTPRHRFIRRYRALGTTTWHDVFEHDLAEHLDALYADRPLCLAGDDDEDPVATISQPSFVLRMLEMLRLGPGHRVFELGAGSGWNAALMGQLVGPEGHVVSLELDFELAATARENVLAGGATNVSIAVGDGGGGYPSRAPFDRAIFTAGMYDLPRPFFDQTIDGGLLLMVLKSEGGGDCLYLLEKTRDHFVSRAAAPCSFVALRGKYAGEDLSPGLSEALPSWGQLRRQEISRVPFSCGNELAPFVWRTQGFRRYLSITDPSFRAFRETSADGRRTYSFGLWDPLDGSLAIAKDDSLIGYGSPQAFERFRRRLDEWMKLGMPDGTHFTLELYPADHGIVPSVNQWLVRRRQSAFLWSLVPGSASTK